MDTTPTALISTRGLARSFGRVEAVRGVDLDVAAGSITALIGPNGSGKTTLMLMLASLVAPDSGSIRIAGIDPAADPWGVRRIIGWMPDSLGAWGGVSCAKALELTGRLHGMARAAARARALELLDLVRLGPFATYPARVLSRGQKQQLSFARALMHAPRVLLLDEPQSGLDPAARASMRGTLRTLARDGVTMLVASHDLAELDAIVDDAVYLAAGRSAPREAVEQARGAVPRWRVRSLDPAGLGRAVAGSMRIVPDERTLVGGAALPRSDGSFVVGAVDEHDAAALLARLATRTPIIEFAPVAARLERAFEELARDDPRESVASRDDGPASPAPAAAPTAAPTTTAPGEEQPR